MITIKESEYIEQTLVPELLDTLARQEDAVREAAYHGDLRENAEYEIAKGERDSTKESIRKLKQLASSPKIIPQSRGIVVGNVVRITPVDPAQYGDIGIEYKEDRFNIGPISIPCVQHIAEILNDTPRGFINKSAPLINQVLGKPSGTYEICLENGRRTYNYEIILD